MNPHTETPAQRRERIATAALQGLLANTALDNSPSADAGWAIKSADALIAALDKDAVKEPEESEALKNIVENMERENAELTERATRAEALLREAADALRSGYESERYAAHRRIVQFFEGKGGAQ